MAAWRRAGSPTRRSPSLVKATNEGNALPDETPAPSAEGMMTGRPPSITAAAEFEVPRSMPITRAMVLLLSLESIQKVRMPAAEVKFSA